MSAYSTLAPVGFRIHLYEVRWSGNAGSLLRKAVHSWFGETGRLVATRAVSCCAHLWWPHMYRLVLVGKPPSRPSLRARFPPTNAGSLLPRNIVMHLRWNMRIFPLPRDPFVAEGAWTKGASSASNGRSCLALVILSVFKLLD